MKVIHYFAIEFIGDRYKIASALRLEKPHIISLIKEKKRQEPDVVMALAACKLEVES